MKAMILERFGGTERFAVATVPAPVPKRGEVLVTIKAAGVNAEFNLQMQQNSD